MRPVVDEEMLQAAVYSLQNEKLVMGESVFKFEEEFEYALSHDQLLVLQRVHCGLEHLLVYHRPHQRNLESALDMGTGLGDANGICGEDRFFSRLSLP